MKTPIALRLAEIAVCVALFASLAYAQTTPDPPSSAVVSPSATDMKPESIQPGTPSITEDRTESIAVDPTTLLPTLPSVSGKKATLVGGTLDRLDRVRDQVTVRLFGGGQMSALFDPRTRVYRAGKQVTISDLRQGDRIYLDTVLDGTSVFARVIRLDSAAAGGESQGIVLNNRGDEVTLRDGLNPSPVDIRLSSSTKFFYNHQSVSPSLLQPGSLVTVSFEAHGNGHDVAREITILALPGTRFTFRGQVVHIDLRTGLLVLNSSTDHKTYELYLDPSSPPNDNLHPGANVTVIASFEDSRYVAQTITIVSQEK